MAGAFKTCLKCNGHYMAKDSDYKQFCSEQCSRQYQLKIMSSGKQKKNKRKTNRFEKRAFKRKKKLVEKRIQYKTQTIDFLDSKEWKALRMEAFHLFGRACACCGAKPPDTILHVDHIKPRYHYPELALDINNLQILCRDCNIGKGVRYETNFRKTL